MCKNRATLLHTCHEHTAQCTRIHTRTVSELLVTYNSCMSGHLSHQLEEAAVLMPATPLTSFTPSVFSRLIRRVLLG